MPDILEPFSKGPLPNQQLPSGLLAFLFTDIEGSTQRWEAWPDAMQIALARHDSIVWTEASCRGGHIFHRAGDSFCIAFNSVANALEAAIAIQRALRHSQAFDTVQGIRVRSAIHIGEAEARDGDYFGKPLNRVSRLLNVANGGQILLSSAAAELIQPNLPTQIGLLSLGKHQLKDLPEPERIYQVEGPGLIASFPPLRTSSRRLNNLPQEVTSFVGRSNEVRNVRARLAESRLVSLVGAGGLGKTRIALQVGRALTDEYPDGVWLIELSPVEDNELIPELLCRGLDIPVPAARSAIESAVAYLHDRKALLIFDNYEHLIPGTANVTKTILRSCPFIAVLATGREHLGAEGESIFHVPSLAFPEDENVTPDAAGSFPAVQLFVDRAKTATSDFNLTSENASTICTICRRLEGIPLAIELAVARLRMMRPDQLAKRLDDRFRLLTNGYRTALPRHQTLRATYDWSYNLLDEREKALLRRLAVFPGGWTLEAATHVAAGNLILAEDVFELTTALVQKSFAFADQTTEEPRFRMLETTRQYGFERLLECGERGYRRRLAEYLISLFANAEAAWPTAPTKDWLATYAPDVENLRAALEWAFGHEDSINVGLELASYNLRIWDELALLTERKRWFGVAVANIESTTPLATQARLWLGRTSVSAHGDRSGFEPATRAAALFHSIDDHRGWGDALMRAGASLLTPDTVAEAEPYLHQALGLLRPLGHSKQLASCLRSIALTKSFRGEFEAARPLIRQSMEIARSVGDLRGISSAEINMAELEFRCGEVDPAILRTQRMIQSGVHNRRQLALALSNLSAYLIAAGRAGEAKQAAESCLRETKALGDPGATARIVENVAALALEDYELDLAGRLLGFGVSFYARGTASREYTEQISHDRALQFLKQRLAPNQLQQLLDHGATWSEEEAISAALQLSRS